MDITFVTGNQEKLREVKEILGSEIEVESKDIDLDEIQDVDGNKVIRKKAQTAYDLIKKPLIVEDTSLYINSWNGLPGALNRWFMKTVGNKGIIKMLLNFSNRSAMAQTIIAFHD